MEWALGMCNPLRVTQTHLFHTALQLRERLQCGLIALARNGGGSLRVGLEFLELCVGLVDFGAQFEALLFERPDLAPR
jgi:hypothetical protein